MSIHTWLDVLMSILLIESLRKCDVTNDEYLLIPLELWSAHFK